MRRITAPIIITVLLVCTLFMSFNSETAETKSWRSQTITVPDDYSTIQEAIDVASDGDTVFVRNGTYHEHLLVNQPISIIGEHINNTVIDGQGENQTIVDLIANNILFRGFTVKNTSRFAGTSYAAIRISGHACNIISNHVTETKIGIFATSQDTIITANIATNNGHGIALYSSSNTTVKANNVSVNTVGISLALSYDNIIEDNTARNSASGGHGITLSSNSYDNIIRRNEMKFNYHGMWLSDSTNNEIFENRIAYNVLLGIELSDSSSNIFYKNNLLTNPKHVILDSLSISHWNNSCEGNHWSDYNGNDSDGDGIGDTPYAIKIDNQDNFPLMNPYWSPADINHDLEVDIYDVVSACVAYNSTTSDPRWNCHCDIAEPYGVIDIFDIVMICANYGEEWS